jgi:hypothetical protein
MMRIVTVTPRELLAVVLIGSVVAVLFGAVPLARWVNALPDFPGVSTAQQAADRWREVARGWQLDAPYDALHRAARDAEGARFGD